MKHKGIHPVYKIEVLHDENLIITFFNGGCIKERPITKSRLKLIRSCAGHFKADSMFGISERITRKK